MMKKTREEILAKLNEIAKPSDTWLTEAQFRVANQHWLKHSQAIALKILRTLRKQKKTQKQLAAALQVSPQQVNKWVKGKENFTLETIAKIEAALNISLIEIPREKKESQVIKLTKAFRVEQTQSLPKKKTAQQNYTLQTKGKVVKLSASMEPSTPNNEANIA